MALQLPAQPITQPVAARYLPLGAYSKQYADIYAIRSNAAALARLSQSSAAVYAERRFSQSDLNLYAFAAGITTKAGAFAVHGNYFGFGMFNQSHLSLAYGMRLSSKVDAGLQFNYFSLRQGNGYGNASSINASAGAVFHLTDKVHAGINIYNPVGSKWSKGRDEKLPSQYTFGLGYEASDKLFLSAEAVKDEDLPASVNAGLQYRFTKQFFGRAGVSTATTSYYAAIGFQLDAFRADIAASYQSPLGISPGILFLFQFGRKRTQTTEQPSE
jgi:hypothetical protein